MSKLDFINVQEYVQLKGRYDRMVQEIVQGRISSGQTQEEVAQWVNVDRRRIMSFEKCEKIDIELFCVLCSKFDVEINNLL